jgi:predicted nucleic acid-binding protein
VEALILDASVLIGLLDSADTHHGRAIDDVEAADREGRQLLLPASVYSETLVALARARRLDEARRAIKALAASAQTGVAHFPAASRATACAGRRRRPDRRSR